MSFVDGIEYGKNQHFEVNQLQNLHHSMSIATSACADIIVKRGKGGFSWIGFLAPGNNL